jgi:GPH family glycoside/pentoside/hexuronide:cation symporter
MADAAESELASGTGNAYDQRIPLSAILTWVSPAPCLGFMFFLVSMYLMKFSTDVLLIAPGAMGMIFGISRIWDGISDPLAGYFSDRTRTRIGRRRPWILASLVPAVAVFLMMWSPPQSLTERELVVWMGVSVIGFYTAMTLFTVPHASLGAELSMNYDDRNRVFGWRHISFTSGAFAALGGMTLLIASDTPRATANQMAMVICLLTVVVMVFCVARVRERPEHLGRGAANPFGAFRDVLKNPHARRLLIASLIEHLGSANISILTPYAAHYIIGTPHLTSFFVLCYMVAAVSTALFWARLAKRYDKKQLWVFSMMLTALSFGGMFFWGEGDWIPIALLATLGGVGGGCGPVIAPSIQSDIIDYDEYLTGERKEGAYFAAFSFAFKGSAGITLMLTGFVLQFSGFVPNVEQTETAKLAIRSLFALFPLISLSCGALLLSRLALNRETHAEVRAARRSLRSGRARTQGTSPL